MDMRLSFPERIWFQKSMANQRNCNASYGHRLEDLIGHGGKSQQVCPTLGMKFAPFSANFCLNIFHCHFHFAEIVVFDPDPLIKIKAIWGVKRKTDRPIRATNASILQFQGFL